MPRNTDILQPPRTVVISGDASGSGGLDKGIVSSLMDKSVSYAKIQDVSGGNLIIGRSSTDSGTIQEIACSAAGRSVIAATGATEQRTALVLGSMSTQSSTTVNITGGSISGTSIASSAVAITGGIVTSTGGTLISSGLTLTALFDAPSAPTTGQPVYVVGRVYYDSTLNKLRVGGATTYETITSI